MITLANLKRTSEVVQPPRLLIYGPPGMGKTSLAAEFPNPVIADVERGAPSGVDVVSLGEIETYDDLVNGLSALYNQDHDFKTLIVDTLDRLEPLVWQKVCQDNHWSTIEEAGYGKGYVTADVYWRDVVQWCNALRKDRGMTICLVAHSSVGTAPDPRGADYQRYDIRLHKRAQAIWQDEVDAILMVNQEAGIKEEVEGKGDKARVVDRWAAGSATRYIYCEGRPSFVAKNRYGLPDRIVYKKGTGYEQIRAYLPTHG